MPVPMRDGVRLTANIFLPAEHAHLPAILVRTPYGKGVDLIPNYQAFVDRGYAVVVEDVVTTGGSTREVVDLLRAAGARVLSAGSIIDRSGGSADVGVPRVALETLNAVSYRQEDCPLCRQGIPVVKPGSRPTA